MTTAPVDIPALVDAKDVNRHVVIALELSVYDEDARCTCEEEHRRRWAVPIDETDEQRQLELAALRSLDDVVRGGGPSPLGHGRGTQLRRRPVRRAPLQLRGGLDDVESPIHLVYLS